MGAYINRRREYNNAGAITGDPIPLNRWTEGNYTFAASGGTFDVNFEGTISRLNVIPKFGEQPVTANWFPITGATLNADGSVSISHTPLEAVRPRFVSQTGITTIEVMQQGDAES